MDEAARQRVERLRSETAIEWAELSDVHGAEMSEFNEAYKDQLRDLGLDEQEVVEEWMAMVREATPGADRPRDLGGEDPAGEQE